MAIVNSPDKNTDHLLRTEGLTKFLGGVGAVMDFDMVVKRGEILALIGPNGAGKTTLFNLTTGFIPPTRGKVLYKGDDISHLKPHQVAKKGVVRSFQANILFMNKTVRENVLLGFHTKYRKGFLAEIINTKGYRKERTEIEEKADEILDFLNLLGLRDQLAGNLTHGYQRMLGVAAALAPGPDLLLLDEPVTGMNDKETAMMMKLIGEIRDKGVTIVLVEHDMKAVMGNAERIVVMDYGKKIAEGSPSEIANNEKVIEAYLGVGEFKVETLEDRGI